MLNLIAIHGIYQLHFWCNSNFCQLTKYTACHCQQHIRSPLSAECHRNHQCLPKPLHVTVFLSLLVRCGWVQVLKLFDFLDVILGFVQSDVNVLFGNRLCLHVWSGFLCKNTIQKNSNTEISKRTTYCLCNVLCLQYICKHGSQ